MKVSTENDNNFGYEKITILVDNIPLTYNVLTLKIRQRSRVKSGPFIIHDLSLGL